jgi:hypothetical protein
VIDKRLIAQAILTMREANIGRPSVRFLPYGEPNEMDRYEASYKREHPFTKCIFYRMDGVHNNG